MIVIILGTSSGITSVLEFHFELSTLWFLQDTHFWRQSKLSVSHPEVQWKRSRTMLLV